MRRLARYVVPSFQAAKKWRNKVAGTLEKNGIPLKARVQPRIEDALLVILPVAMILAFMPFADPATGLLLMFSAILILIRTKRWKLWQGTDLLPALKRVVTDTEY